MATKFDNLQVSGSGLSISRLPFGKANKTKTQPTPQQLQLQQQQQQQQQALRAGPGGLLGNQMITERALIPVKSFHPMTTEQQLRTVFVSKIPELMDTNTLRAILDVIPGVESIVRLLNGRSEPLSFGFVRFLSVDSIKVFMDTFKRVNYSQLTHGNFESLFSIVCEENTTRFIEDLVAERGEEYFRSISRVSEKELVDSVSRQIKTWYELTSATYGDNLTIKLQSLDMADENANRNDEDDFDLDETNLDNIKIDESEFADLEIEDKDTVLREIKEFRLLSMKFEKAKKDQEVEEKKERDKYLEKLTSKVLADANGAAKRQGGDEDRLFTEQDFKEMSDSDDDPSESDEKLEEIRQARIKQKEERVFEGEQRWWIARERMHNSAVERQKQHDDNLEERTQHDRQKALREFAEFVDGGDYERNNFEYYLNHAKWAKKRQIARQREIAQDEQDALDEAEEIAQKKTEKESFLSSLASDITAKSKTATTTTTTTTASSIDSSGKFKLSLGGVKKKAPAQQQQQDEDETEEKEAKAAVRAQLPSAVYETLKELDDIKSITNNNSLVTSIIDSISNESTVLFASPVNWEYLTDDIIQDRLKPFIATLMMEYLGIQEDELIAFIVNHLKEHKDADSLVSELEMTLDEDAVVFTQKLWRLLLFETECQKAGV